MPNHLLIFQSLFRQLTSPRFSNQYPICRILVRLVPLKICSTTKPGQRQTVGRKPHQPTRTPKASSEKLRTIFLCQTDGNGMMSGVWTSTDRVMTRGLSIQWIQNKAAMLPRKKCITLFEGVVLFDVVYRKPVRQSLSER